MRGGTISLLAILLFAPLTTGAPAGPGAPQVDDENIREEAPQLAASGNIARRDGATLTIRRGDRPIASFTNGNPYCGKMPCDSWEYMTRLSLRPRPDAPPEIHALIAFQPFDLGEMAIVDRDGRLIWFEYNLRAQTDGRYVASGSFNLTHTSPHFIIIDWASPGHRAGWRSDLACDPLRWRPDDVLMALCKTSAEGGPTNTAFYIRRTGETWQITEAGSLSQEDFSHLLSGEPYALKPLKTQPRSFTMTPMTYDESQWPMFDSERIDRRAGGYRRLAWP